MTLWRSELKKEWLIEENKSFQGWDFSHIENRSESEPLPWDYRQLINEHLKETDKLLDMGTGGGEFLLTLNHPYHDTYVTEAYLPNVELCKKRLAPLGITVNQIKEDDILPYENEKFDVIINRHESYNIHELYRVLKPKGIFITQQVGEQNNNTLSEILIEGFKKQYVNHNLLTNHSMLTDIGFEILKEGEYFPILKFYDVGAIVFFAKIIEWEFPSFSVERCFDKLLILHKMIDEKGYIESVEHRFFLVARKQ